MSGLSIFFEVGDGPSPYDEPLRRVQENEAEVKPGYVVVRTVVVNELGYLTEGILNVMVPLANTLGMVDEGRGAYVPNMPSANADIVDGRVTPVRWAVMERKFRPGVTVLDLWVTPGEPDVPVRAELGCDDGEATEQMVLRVRSSQ